MKVRGRWAYLYRAVDKHGNTIDFYLSPTRNTAAAKRFLGKVLHGSKDWEQPEIINTDKAPTYATALTELIATEPSGRSLAGHRCPVPFGLDPNGTERCRKA